MVSLQERSPSTRSAKKKEKLYIANKSKRVERRSGSQKFGRYKGKKNRN